MPALTDHPSTCQPAAQDVHLWRYMDFSKFVYMLDTNRLYFPRLDQFDDPYEGTLSKAEFESIEQRAQQREEQGDLPGDFIGRYFDILMLKHREIRKCMYANCWYLSDVESEAMWKLYSNQDSGIAIKTSYAKLASAIPNFESIRQNNPLDGNGKLLECYIGVVSYVDHHADAIFNDNVLQTVMQKRKSLKHEREVRIVITARQPGLTYDWKPEDVYPTGLTVPVTVNDLIETAVVSPTAPEWFFRAVVGVVQRYGGCLSVRRSELCSRPYI